jgi:pilus assembly protein CpaF
MLQDLFVFEREGMEDGRIVGRTVSTGIRPHFIEKMKASSHGVDTSVFDYLKT